MASHLDAWCLLPGLAQRTWSVSSEGRALLTDTGHVPGPKHGVLYATSTRDVAMVPAEALEPSATWQVTLSFL